MSDQYALCWNNYKKNLSSGFYSLYSKGDFTDVTLSADGQLIQAHRIVLAVCSPYFKNLFEKTPATNHPIVFLKDISYKNLTDLIQFMYSGEVHVKQDDLPSFIAIAESLQIKGLTEFGVNDNETSSTTKNGENTSMSRSARANKRALRKELPEDDIPLKYRKRTSHTRSTRNSSKNDEDPLEDGASTSQMNYVAAKCEPVLEDSNMDDDHFDTGFDKDDDDNEIFENSNYLNTSNNTSNQQDKASTAPQTVPITPQDDQEFQNPDSEAPVPVEFFPTKMGGYVMVHDSQIYSLERRGGDHWYWCCNLKGPRRCPARCQTTSQFDSVVIRNSDHNHPDRTAEIERRRLRVTATAGPDDCAEWMRRLEAQQNLKEERKQENNKDEN